MKPPEILKKGHVHKTVESTELGQAEIAIEVKLWEDMTAEEKAEMIWRERESTD